MIHIWGFLAIFLIILVVVIRNYTLHAEKLIVFHKYSIIVDILSWIGGIALIMISIVYYDLVPKFNYLLWGQIIIGSALLNIHVVRFVLHIRSPDKFHYARKGRKH